MAIFSWAALYFMPVFAFVFLYAAFRTFIKIKDNQSHGADLFTSCLFFALMMWTISGLLLIGAR